MAHIFGLLQGPTARQHLACRLKDNCKMGGVITPGSIYVNIINRNIALIADSVVEDGRVREREVTKTYYRRMHPECFVEWFLYVSARRAEWVAKQPKGRPVNTGVLTTLTPEIKAQRRKLLLRRNYLVRKTTSELPMVTRIQAIAEVLDINDTVKDWGAPVQVSMARSESTIPQDLICPRRHHRSKRRIHELGEDYHCLHCGSCYSQSHEPHV